MSKLIDKAEDILSSISRFVVSSDLPDYCDLRTIVRLTPTDKSFRPNLSKPYIAVTEKGDYCTTFEAQGSFCEMDESADRDKKFSFDGFIERVTTALTTDFKSPGHKISMVFESDPHRAKEELERLFAHHYSSIDRTNLAMKDLLDEKIEKIAPWVSRERAFVTCWSSRVGMSAHELKSENKRIAQIAAKAPPHRFGQNPAYSELTGLKIRHDAFLSVVEHAFNDSGDGLLMDVIDVPSLGNHIRQQVDRNGTSDNWCPAIPGEKLRPSGRRKGNDISPFMAPWLNFQIMNCDAKTDDNFICINGVWHATLSVSLGPQQIMHFSRLKALIPREVPYRIRFDIMPGGMAALGWKKFILDFSAFIPSLRPIWESVDALQKRDAFEPVCVMTICASTWGNSKEEALQNLTLLQKAFQGWGVCEVTTVFGDPFKAWASTLVSARTGGGPHALYPPLGEALSMLPLGRPASAWTDNASVVFPTPDGKMVPVVLASSQQTKHTEIIAGVPGSGKSLMLNMLDNSLVTTAQTHIPFIAKVDKGYSAQGQIQLIRDNLPEHRKDEVIGIVLRNDPSHCKNMFDLQLGAKYPLEPERSWMVSVLYAMCIDPTTGNPPNAGDIRTLLERIVMIAFKRNAEIEPRCYAPGEAPEVDEALRQSGLFEKYDEHWWEVCPYYDVRDMLFDAGFESAAQSAQFMAVPELTDMQNSLSDEEITSSFGKVTRDGSNSDLLVEYVSRRLGAATSEFKMLAGRTQFVISPQTRIIAVDLNNVTGDTTKAGQLKTGIMYLFAGQISGGHFILPQYQDELLKSVPKMYHTMHLDRLEQLDQEVKTKLYDELHNAKDVPFIFQALETQDREQRKFGIRTVLSSQYLGDFPDVILKSANSLYLMDCRNEDAQILTKHFDVPEVTVNRFLQIPRGPAPDGSGPSFLGVFRTKSGRIARILKNTMGAKEIWALNSTPSDTALRKQLYSELDGRTARDILAESFPSGSANRLIETRRKRAGERDGTRIIAQLADELIDKRGYRI
ncbi:MULTISPECIES: ATP-binding protein [Rosenbergiella]|uniref:ATP-binding protein n=1 Tax=Rosenbergiella TaxID=1356488 RepID=UPI001F501F56|nr:MULTISPECIES: ATP-binding protein [Rosenbergiella]